MLGGMEEKPAEAEWDFAGEPSPPRAPLAVRMLVYLLLLALAGAAIWWIDRGAAMTNGHT